MLDVALRRDMDILIRIFAPYNQRVLYEHVYLQFKDINKKLKMFQTETDILCRYRWKYKYLTLAEFNQYY
jgi:hypothetical protein